MHTMFAVLSILCTNIITLPLRVRAPCSVLRAQAQSQSQSQSQMLLGSLPGSCSDLSQFVSLSASRVGDEVGGGGVARGAAAVHLPLACLCFCYSFILICLPLRFIFLRCFSLPAPFHSFSPFSPHFVSHFS